MNIEDNEDQQKSKKKQKNGSSKIAEQTRSSNDNEEDSGSPTKNKTEKKEKKNKKRGNVRDAKMEKAKCEDAIKDRESTERQGSPVSEEIEQRMNNNKKKGKVKDKSKTQSNNVEFVGDSQREEWTGNNNESLENTEEHQNLTEQMKKKPNVGDQSQEGPLRRFWKSLIGNRTAGVKNPEEIHSKVLQKTEEVAPILTNEIQIMKYDKSPRAKKKTTRSHEEENEELNLSSLETSSVVGTSLQTSNKADTDILHEQLQNTHSKDDIIKEEGQSKENMFTRLFSSVRHSLRRRKPKQRKSIEVSIADNEEQNIGTHIDNQSPQENVTDNTAIIIQEEDPKSRERPQNEDENQKDRIKGSEDNEVLENSVEHQKKIGFFERIFGKRRGKHSRSEDLESEFSSPKLRPSSLMPKDKSKSEGFIFESEDEGSELPPIDSGIRKSRSNTSLAVLGVLIYDKSPWVSRRNILNSDDEEKSPRISSSTNEKEEQNHEALNSNTELSEDIKTLIDRNESKKKVDDITTEFSNEESIEKVHDGVFQINKKHEECSRFKIEKVSDNSQEIDEECNTDSHSSPTQPHDIQENVNKNLEDKMKTQANDDFSYPSSINKSSKLFEEISSEDTLTEANNDVPKAILQTHKLQDNLVPSLSFTVENQDIEQDFEDKMMETIRKIKIECDNLIPDIEMFSDSEESSGFFFLDESLVRYIHELDSIDIKKNIKLKRERREVVKYIYRLMDKLDSRVAR